MLALDGEFFKLVVLFENAEAWDSVLLRWLVRRRVVYFGHGGRMDGRWNDAVGERRVSAVSEIIEACCHNTFLFSPHPPQEFLPSTHRRIRLPSANARGQVEGHRVHHDRLPATSGRHDDPALPLVFMPGF